MGIFKDISGQRFGRLIVTGKHEARGHNRYWMCRCECNNTTWVSTTNLKNKHVQSCGCFNKELTRERTITHGQSKTPTYMVWKGMRKRCNNPNDKKYSDYGGRGIKVLREWDFFEQFLKDMGERPSSKHSIDRIDNDGPYCGNNCRWAVRRTQMNNMRTNKMITHNNETKTVSQWADLSPVSYQAFWQRLYKLNWSIEKALSTP